MGGDGLGKRFYAQLVLTGETDQVFQLEKSIVTLGRQSNNDIVLTSGKISRTHAQFKYDGEQCVLVDLDSLNGVKVNGTIVKKTVLSPGDLIAIGDHVMRFEKALPIDPKSTIQIDSLDELENTLASTVLYTTLTNTQVPRLVIHSYNGTWEHSLEPGGATIGRSNENDIVLPFDEVSRYHAVVEYLGDAFFVRDLNSANGTYIGSRRIETNQLHACTTVKIGPARLVFKPGFEAEELCFVDQPTTRLIGNRRPVVFVPGLMGSQLWRGSEQLWPNVRNLYRDPEQLKLPGAPNIEPRGLVQEVVVVPNLLKLAQYNRLGDYLVEELGYERERDLLEFAYDWRKDVRDSALQLAAAIEAWDHPAPITIIAHSLGCLVSRYYINCLGGDRKVERIVLMGGPHQGTPKAITALLTKGNLLPFGFMGERVRDIFRTFPSSYQILPTYNCVVEKGGTTIDLFSNHEWLPVEQRPKLRYGRKYLRQVGNTLKVPSISIFGYGQRTITGIEVEFDVNRFWLALNLNFKNKGDETVPEHSAVLQGSEIHPVQQSHGSLYVDNDVKMRLKIELTRGYRSNDL